MPSSFFEKLKKGMNIDEIITEDEVLTEQEETPPEVIPEPEKKQKKVVLKEEKKPTKAKAKTKKPAKKVKPKEEIEEELPQFEVETLITETNTSVIATTMVEENIEPENKEWSSLVKDEAEGELMIDVFQTEKELVIQSAIAGVKIEDLEISIEREVITIKGRREKDTKENQDYFIKECFWGPFSREIIAPVEINPGETKASFNNGILTIKIPKIEREKKMKINLVG